MAELGCERVLTCSGAAFSPGSAVASVTIAPGSLTGLTVYGVSVAFYPLTLAVVANSAVSSHTF